MSERQHLDGDGRSIRQLELELELARLRREQEEEEETLPHAAQEEVEEVPVVPPPVLPPSSTPINAQHQQQGAYIPQPQPPPPATPANTLHHQGTPHPATGNQQPANLRTRGQGRGGRGGGARTARGERGLLTVFVCVAHNDLCAMHTDPQINTGKGTKTSDK